MTPEPSYPLSVDGVLDPDRTEVLAHMPRLIAALHDHDTYRLLGIV